MSDLAECPSRQSSPPPRRRGRLPALLLFVLLVGALVAGVVVGGRAVLAQLSGSGTPDYAGAGQGEVLVQVKVGQAAAAIATTLLGEDVVKSEVAFTKAATADPRSLSVQPGFYRLHSQMSGAAAVALLLDPAARARSRVTLPEGSTLAVTLKKISEATEVPLADLQTAVADPAAIGLPAYAKGQVEGFLFPATYDVEPGTSAVATLRMMTARFAKAAAEADLDAKAAALGRSPYDVLVTASLIEKETAFAPDRSKVARVIYNRLAGNMPLQLDSTVNYLRTDKKARLTLEDLKQVSPYNTYLVPGLPPTPIDSPGQDAITAALDPAAGDYRYFVTVSKDGSSLFTADYSEFLKAKAKAQAEGVY
jgi:UPF0755 protein